MKVLNLNINFQSLQAPHLIKAKLKKDINAFKATNLQFLRNNQAFNPATTGMIA
ncbi:hypothetical protein LX99_04421 [Mucilaginibacter oryzae]|uniref:Uncharacterized protein n=1 Tax=Mucilaginibacter oryzae TaxID=468058 RepID=A0A316GZT5_9SPHI|nr:hypothetical protein [Mucilaginibacter oryzae]PWK71398.1 hypothetical protein LX99_04421 [Mucilaginibacter oryzae]